MNGPLTIRALLLGTGPLTAPQNAGWAAALGKQRRLPTAVREAAEGELLAALAATLEIDLGGLLVAGWRQHPALRRAGRATRQAAGSTELVTLVAHRISSTHRPQVDLLVNEVLTAVVEFEVELVAEVDCLVATVRAGQLAQVHSGLCRVRASVACAGEPIAYEQVTLEVPPLVPVGVGIPLVRSDDQRPATVDSARSTNAVGSRRGSVTPSA